MFKACSLVKNAGLLKVKTRLTTLQKQNILLHLRPAYVSMGTGYLGRNFLRLGTVDVSNLVKTKLRPQVERFTKHSMS